jgi:hypothetical protein
LPERGVSTPARAHAALNRSRSSAVWIASSEAPMSSTPYFARMPFSAELDREVQARLPADRRQQCVGPLALDDALEDRHGQGLDVRRSATPGSVMIVAGFELTSTTSMPSRLSTRHACVPE